MLTHLKGSCAFVLSRRPTDGVPGLEDLMVVLCVLDLGGRLVLLLLVLAAGTAALRLRVLLHPGEGAGDVQHVSMKGYPP